MRNSGSLATACLTVESLFVLTQKEPRPPKGVVGDVSKILEGMRDNHNAYFSVDQCSIICSGTQFYGNAIQDFKLQRVMLTSPIEGSTYCEERCARHGKVSLPSVTSNIEENKHYIRLGERWCWVDGGGSREDNIGLSQG